MDSEGSSSGMRARATRRRSRWSRPARTAQRWALAAMWVLVLGSCGPVPEPRFDAEPEVARLAAHRAGLSAYAAELGPGAPNGLAAFAAFAQHAADVAVLRVGAEAAPRAFLDDLIDLSLGADRPFLQRLLMVSPPLWRGPPLHESTFGTDGFARAFREGEGRVRHFVLAAAGAWAFPPLWVETAARWIGRDIVVAPGTDSAADVLTNAVGRDFGLWLRSVEPATFADGASVAAWIRSRFAEPVG